MVRRFIALAVVCTLIAIAIGLYNRGVLSQATVDPSEFGTLHDIAAGAAASGETEVHYSVHPMYEGVDNFDQALDRYTIMEATVIDKRSYILDATAIGTWNKFKINAVLTQKPLPQCPTCSSVADPPADMLPLNSDEFVLLHGTASQIVEGVTLFAHEDEFPDFMFNQKYLIFMDFDATKRAGSAKLGPGGVFMVNADGTLTPVTEEDPGENPLVDAIAARYGNSIFRFRAALNPVSIDPNAYYRMVVQHSGKCMDVQNASYANGAPVMQYDCHDGLNQKWRFVPMSDGFYEIISANSGKCLDVNQGSTADGAQIMQYDCHGGTNQQWILNAEDGGFNVLVARNSGRVPSIAGVSYANGAKVLQWYYDFAPHQKWQLSLTSGPPPPPTCDPAQEQDCYNRGGSWDSGSCYCIEPDPCASYPWNCY
ncbi:MAG: hypothetical protein QOF02_930 [Blastocatellia bacterium]|jgi:hypothetical protein|nr:hypothetical protein [Blastocatellia bacterium]